MAKKARKRTATVSAVPSSKRPKSTKLEKARARSSTRTGTKQSTAIEMLRSPPGATIDALTSATGWQQHSVRGFLAGVVRKRLKLDLQSTVVDGVRVYRVPNEHSANAMRTQAGQKS